jgi:predicted DNA-binding antitoxin AbrB/MazE fold protein
MIQQIDAIYENGLLRPSQPLRLAEHERVHVLIVPQGEDDLLDRDFTIDANDVAPELAEVRVALSTIKGSMDDAINELRGEY